MSNKKPKYASHKKKRTSKAVPVMIGIVVLLVILIVVMLVMVSMRSSTKKSDKVSATEVTVTTEILETTSTTEASTEPTVIETTAPVPVETEPQKMLPFFVEKIQENPDVAGWIKIEGTKLNYPVMYTPSEEDKYLHADYNGNWSIAGQPYVEETCSLSPESDNLIIYGHNMANGTMFNTLVKYEQKNFWEEHPKISFSTLYEERTYEIIAAFYDRVYYKYEDCFKFYQFIDARDEAHFNEAITYYKEHALYDTGVSAEYGDNLITLVTCAYHVDNGRFVVVAKDITDRS